MPASSAHLEGGEDKIGGRRVFGSIKTVKFLVIFASWRRGFSDLTGIGRNRILPFPNPWPIFFAKRMVCCILRSFCWGDCPCCAKIGAVQRALSWSSCAHFSCRRASKWCVPARAPLGLSAGLYVIVQRAAPRDAVAPMVRIKRKFKNQRGSRFMPA